jgi:hypothetical protein
VSVAQHRYALPDDDELAQLVGAASPHFALQIRDRIAPHRDALPRDHPRRAFLAQQIARLERIATEGESAGVSRPDLPPRPSLSGLAG